MKKNATRTKKLMLSFFAMLVPLLVNAQKVEIDGIWYNLVSKIKQAVVTKSEGEKYFGDITIPATVTYEGVDYSVTSIGESAFAGCSSLTAITLLDAETYAVGMCAQQLQTGDSFEFTNADGVTKTYKVVGENLIENPSFDNGTYGWTGGGGGTLGSTEVNYSGGVDGGAYIRPTSSSGKGSDNSIGTAWDVEVGKTYVFSFFLKNQTNTAAESPAGDGYIKVSMSSTYRDETLVLQPLPHVDADLAWTQNTWVVTAEYSSLALCARWLGGAKCFDAFILAEVEELADAKELEDLLIECGTWMDHFGDDAKEYETISALADEAQELIDGGEYTVAELNAMVHNLKESLLDFRVANANDENPVDVTERYIKNTKFDNSWTGWDVVNAAVNNGMNIRNFAYFEPGLNPVAEINGAPSTEASISQTVHNLPMGYYRFTVQAVMSHSVDVNDPEAKSGAIIFCNGSELDMVTKEQTAGGAANDASYPETFSVEGYVSDGTLEVGFVGESGASFSYVAIDNARLEYLGHDGVSGLYVVTYVVDGEVYKKDTLEAGKNVPLAECPYKEGRTFGGWNNVPGRMPFRNIVIDGGFYYGVTFEIEDTAIFLDSVEYGKKIILPDAPNKEGYTFNGWGAPETMPAEDIVLVGTYTINAYKLDYVADGILFHSSTVVYGDSIVPLSKEPSKEGYTFVGWDNLPVTMPASDVIATAKFEVNRYKITYIVDNRVVAIDSVAYGSDVILMDPPVVEGYTFAGWSYVPATMPASDIMVIGIYIINSYQLTYMVDSVVYESQTIVYGEDVPVPVGPTKEGYTFSGWIGVPETMPAYDVTINGAFTINKYLVTFKIGDEVIASDSLEYGAAIVAPGAPEKEGYTFDGWGDVAETVPAGDVTYEGGYTISSYLLTYTVDGEVVQADSVVYGSAVTALDEPAKEGYTFSGWSDIPATMPAYDVTINGAFTINKYLVTFKIGDEVIALDSLEYGAAIVVPDAPEKEGYTFNGWGDVAETVSAGDVTYEGSYTVNVYNVYYYVGKELVHTAEVAYGEAIPEYMYEPTEEGCTFLGWVGESYDAMPAHDVTYTANIDNGIDQFIIDNSQLTIYDLTGRRVLNTENLKGGIYIVNGRKVIVK